MTWRTEMRPATFRGVAFHVRDQERSGGRSVVVHEFPFSEQPPYTQDTGIKGRSFRVEGYVIGDDYRDRLNALLSALERPGTGQLNHPYLGLRTVAVDSYSERQTSREGGLALVTVVFLESSAEPPSPAATLDAEAAVGTAATRAKTAAAVSFAAGAVGLTDAGTLQFGALNGLVDRFSSQVSSVLAVAAVPAAALAGIRRLIAVPAVTVEQFENNALFFPALLDSLVSATAQALTDAASLVADPIAQILALPDSFTLPEDATDEAIQNFETTRALVVRLSLVAASTALLTRSFASYDDALASRQVVLDAILEHTNEAIDDTYADFVDMRVALAAAVPGVDSSLPRLQRFTPRVTTASLVLVHRLYGSVDGELEVVERNKIRHPAFVPGGLQLEVLSLE